MLPEELKLSARRAWQVKLDNSVILELGRQDIGLRVGRFAASWRDQLSRLPYKWNMWICATPTALPCACRTKAGQGARPCRVRRPE